MVIWEARLIIQFPAGSLILLPSATLTHSNLPVAKGDVRASFTQFAAGGLFRYVDYGLRTEKELREQDPELWEKLTSERSGNWKLGCDLMSNIEDMKQLVKAQSVAP